MGCSNSKDTIVDGDSVGISSLYTKPYDADFGVEVRVGSVLTGFQTEAHDFKAADTFKVKSPGVEDARLNLKTVYSNPVQYSIDKIEVISTTSPQTYKLTLKKEHYLKIGDELTINTITGADSSDCTKYLMSYHQRVFTQKLLVMSTLLDLIISRKRLRK